MKFQHRSLMGRVVRTSRVMRIVERVERERFQRNPQVAPLRMLQSKVHQMCQRLCKLGCNRVLVAAVQARASSSQRLHVWQPRLTRSEAPRMRNDMALSAADLDRFLHTDE